MPAFHNPYNFVPNPDRSELAKRDFDDMLPIGHSALVEGTFRGCLSVGMSVANRLLLLDASRSSVDGNGHASLPLRMVNHAPFVPPSSIRGMMRSAFEIATLSSYGVLTSGQPVRYRIPGKNETAHYVNSPHDLASAAWMEPAPEMQQLSMASRVFGWVRPGLSEQEGVSSAKETPSAIRSQVSVSAVKSIRVNLSSDEKLLAVLSSPRSSYGRFYTGPSAGEPWRQGRAYESAAYDADGARLRGRKVYPHQNHPAYKTQYGVSDRASEQNRTVIGWIDEDSVFEFDIRFDGLDAVELGALMWIIEPSEGFHHKLGAAKPFGYGSVRLRIDPERSAVSDVDAVQRMWKGERPSSVDLPDFVAEYKAAFVHATGVESFEGHPIIATFLLAGTGVDGEVRYPGANKEKGYEWFVANERPGNRYSLPPLGDTLPEL